MIDSSLNIQKSMTMAENQKFQKTIDGINNLRGSVSDKDLERKKLAAAAKEFETLFINEMMKSMRKTVDKSELFGKEGMSQKVYEEMLDNEYAKNAAEKGTGIGLADLMLRQLDQEKNFPSYKLSDYQASMKSKE